MVIKNRFYFLLCFVGLLLPLGLNAQDTDGTKPLADILLHIKQQHAYQFNYAEDTIEGAHLVPPSSELSFQQLLEYLNKNTGLIFTMLNDKVVSIKKIENLTICGYVKSKETLSALPEATIQAQKNSTIADANGFFELTLANEKDLIVFRYLGHKMLKLSYQDIQKKSCADIYLEPELQPLSEIVISDYIVSGINKLNDGGFNIDFSNFDILPGLIEADVLQSVQAFPGILSENETVSNINIRGGTHDQNLILWDDIKMYQSGHFFGLISMFNPQITETVSLLKNGTDVRFTDGVSGTISMKTDVKTNTTFKGNIGANFIDANGFVDIPTGKKSSLQVAARKSISNFAQTPTYKQFFDRISQNTEVETNSENTNNTDKSFDFYDMSLRWLYKISEKDELRVNFINVANELVFDENAEINGVEESRQSNVSQNSIAGGIQYKRVWDEQWQSVISIYETDYKLQAINADILDSQRFLQENKVSETGVSVNTYFRINKRFQFLGGHHFVETKITNLDDVDNPLFRSLVSEVVRTFATYSQLNYAALDKNTNFSFGLRYNYIDKFKKSILEPRLSFNQRFLNYFTLEVLGEFKHQTTSQVINFQSDFLGIEKRRWQLSNDEDIPVMESKQMSAGITYNHFGWLLSTEAYIKEVKGITTQSQGFQNQYEFVKTNGRYEVKGLDLLIRKRLGRFNSWLSYSYMDNVYMFPMLPEKKFPSNFDIEHALTIGLNYKKNNFKIAAGLNWHSGKPTTLPVLNDEVIDDEINYNEANSSRLDDYLRVDISAIYDYTMSKKVKGIIGASIWNVFNNENVINSTYSATNGNSVRLDQNSLGFTPNVVLRIFFN